MTDIVERLRDYAVNGDRPTIWPRQITTKTMSEAAAEIERLRERYDFQVAANRSLVEACAKSEAENERLRAR